MPDESHAKCETPGVRDDISIVLCGGAGQGLQTVETLLPRLLKLSGYHVFSTKEYMSRIRGGTNSTEIRVSSKPVSALVDRIDILVALDPSALVHLEKRIGPGTVIVGDGRILAAGEGDETHEIVHASFLDIAREAGGAKFANTVAVGFLAGMFGIDASLPEEFRNAAFRTSSHPAWSFTMFSANSFRLDSCSRRVLPKAILFLACSWAIL